MAVAAARRRPNRNENSLGPGDSRSEMSKRKDGAAARCYRRESCRPGSKIGIFPAFKYSIFCASLSTQTTLCPKSARHAPDTSPTSNQNRSLQCAYFHPCITTPVTSRALHSTIAAGIGPSCDTLPPDGDTGCTGQLTPPRACRKSPQSKPVLVFVPKGASPPEYVLFLRILGVAFPAGTKVQFHAC